MQPNKNINALVAIMARLRTPGSGCPWDLEQDFSSIAPYTIEEAYEVADAIEREDFDDLRDELGDLLLQVVFHARMAEEGGRFAFGDVVEAITEKLIRRHPHVFGQSESSDPAQVKVQWEAIKADEKAERAARRGSHAGGRTLVSLLRDVPLPLPALTRALKLQQKAAEVGFDWNDPHAVLQKIGEELGEVEHELELASRTHDRLEGEIGDLLFAVVNLARHLSVDPEGALRSANTKFVRRFEHIERALGRQGRSTMSAGLEEMEELWQEAKNLVG
jgi:ATP diphosphatase